MGSEKPGAKEHPLYRQLRVMSSPETWEIFWDVGYIRRSSKLSGHTGFGKETVPGEA